MKQVIKCSACLRNSHNEVEVPPGTVPVCPSCGAKGKLPPPKTMFIPNDMPLFGPRKIQGEVRT